MIRKIPMIIISSKIKKSSITVILKIPIIIMISSKIKKSSGNNGTKNSNNNNKV